MGTQEAEGSVFRLWGSPPGSLPGKRRCWCNFCGFQQPSPELCIPPSTSTHVWGVVVSVLLGLLLHRCGFVTLTVDLRGCAEPRTCALSSQLRRNEAPLAFWSELLSVLLQPCSPEGQCGGRNVPGPGESNENPGHFFLP